MKDEDIQGILDQLGSKVSMLSEENRTCKIRDDAGRELISQLSNYITKEDWVELYNSIENHFVKDLMREWGAHLFPDNHSI